MPNELLKFGKSNAKLDKIKDWHKSDSLWELKYLTFSLPSGYACPSAKDCRSWYNPKTNKMSLHRDAKYTCYATNMQRMKHVRNQYWHNFNLLKPIRYDEIKLTELLINSLVINGRPDYIRIHESGDFFTEEYFKAWCNVARQLPEVTFYAYTKELKTVKKYQDEIPENLVLTLSDGGKHDNLIDKINIKKAVVVKSASDTTLPIDDNEYHAIKTNDDFALVIHGMQLKHK